MLTKILSLFAVIGIVLLLIRFRARRASIPSVKPEKNPLVKQVAIAVVLVMLGTSLIYAYLAWRDAHQVVVLTVIDSRSGAETTYQAFRGDVEFRRFRTLDGRLVELAETERMESQQRSDAGL